MHFLFAGWFVFQPSWEGQVLWICIICLEFTLWNSSVFSKLLLVAVKISKEEVRSKGSKAYPCQAVVSNPPWVQLPERNNFPSNAAPELVASSFGLLEGVEDKTPLLQLHKNNYLKRAIASRCPGALIFSLIESLVRLVINHIQPGSFGFDMGLKIIFWYSLPQFPASFKKLMGGI